MECLDGPFSPPPPRVMKNLSGQGMGGGRGFADGWDPLEGATDKGIMRREQDL